VAEVVRDLAGRQPGLVLVRADNCCGKYLLPKDLGSTSTAAESPGGRQGALTHSQAAVRASASRAAPSVSHGQPELDLVVPLVELDERTRAIDAAGSDLELIEAWRNQLVDIRGFAAQATAKEAPTRQVPEI
jgi:hypothetical protein